MKQKAINHWPRKKIISIHLVGIKVWMKTVIEPHDFCETSDKTMNAWCGL